MKAAKGDEEIDYGLWEEEGESEAMTRAKDNLRSGFTHICVVDLVPTTGCRWLRAIRGDSVGGEACSRNSCFLPCQLGS